MSTVLYGFLWWWFLAVVTLNAGYHRYFSHHSFKAPVWYEYLVLVIGPFGGNLSAFAWAWIHRAHHAYVDTPDDPHSPKHQGFWRIFTSTFKITKLPKHLVDDLFQNKRVMFFHKHHWKIRAITILAGLLLLPFNCFLIFILLPTFFGLLSFGAVNTIGHLYGAPRDSLVLNVVLPGEGNHKVHHDNPGDHRIGKWDPTGLFIEIIRKRNNDSLH